MEKFKLELTSAYDKFQIGVDKGIKEQGSDVIITFIFRNSGLMII
jgi:hypothetical protein